MTRDAIKRPFMVQNGAHRIAWPSGTMICRCNWPRLVIVMAASSRDTCKLGHEPLSCGWRKKLPTILHVCKLRQKHHKAKQNKTQLRSSHLQVASNRAKWANRSRVIHDSRVVSANLGGILASDDVVVAVEVIARRADTMMYVRADTSMLRGIQS